MIDTHIALGNSELTWETRKEEEIVWLFKYLLVYYLSDDFELFQQS